MAPVSLIGRFAIGAVTVLVLIGFVLLAQRLGRTPGASAASPGKSGSPDQALLVYVRLGDDEFGTSEEVEHVHELEEELGKLVEKVQGADLDGDEFGGGFGTIYIYGPSADTLFDALAPTLLRFQARPGSYVVRRYGPPGSREERLPLGDAPGVHNERRPS